MNPTLIAHLVADLQPVKPMRMAYIATSLAAITLFAAAIVVTTLGFRPDLLAGQLEAMFAIRGAILLLLGGSAAATVTMMAYPAAGNGHNNNWHIAMALAVLFPLTAIILAAAGYSGAAFASADSGMECLRYSLVGAAATSIPMVLWLRKGAPSNPGRAGLLTGVASGALGAFAYSLHCPSNDIVYIGLWYGIAVSLSAIIGRLLLPALIKW